METTTNWEESTEYEMNYLRDCRFEITTIQYMVSILYICCSVRNSD